LAITARRKHSGFIAADYPKSQRMQQYFSAETVRLNIEAQPDLKPTTVFEQQQQITIPSIKQLSGKSRAGAKR
jgi:hypothetical protein